MTGNLFVIGVPRRRGRNLRLAATDLGWSSGRGPTVEGPAEGALMAITGRPPYVHVVLVIAEDPLMWIDGVGQYADELVRSDDGWRIRERKYTTSRLIASDPALLEQRG